MSGLCPCGRPGLFPGQGVPQDYGKALQYLNDVTWNSRGADYMRGFIYARGPGVPEDTKKGVEYLQKDGNNAMAKEELLHYKKNLFGKWGRR